MPPLRTPEILIVEADATRSAHLADVLRDGDVTPNITILRDFDAARRHLLDGTRPVPDLVVVDLELPADEGPALLAWLRATPALAIVPLIVTGPPGQSRESNEARAALSATTTFIERPVVVPPFLSTVRELLATKHAVDRATRPVRAHADPEDAVHPVVAVRRALAAGWLWGTIGFVLGTLLLIGPVQWMVGLVRRLGWPSGVERTFVILLVLVLLALVTATTAVVRRRTPTRRGRLIAVIAWSVGAAVTLGAWLTPGALNRLIADAPVLESVYFENGARFDFGAFPAEGSFPRLRRQGYTAVVSLLHPAIIPFEPRMLQTERSGAEKSKLRLIGAPMFPWILGNEESLQQLLVLSTQKDARFYVHCYLGRDRVRMVQRFLVASGGRTSVRLPVFSADVHMERGPVTALGDSVFLGPAPTEDELVAVILARGVRSVVAMLSDTDTAEVALAAHEKSALAPFGVTVTTINTRSTGNDAAAVRTAVEKARAQLRPTYVHAYRNDGAGRSEAFRLEWIRTSTPTAPPR
jgi:CheY-like chemotaxis protein